MKVLAIVLIFATVASLAIAQNEEEECPEEIKNALSDVKDVCMPVIRKRMKGPGGPKGPSGRGPSGSNRRRRQGDADENADLESCLTKLREQSAFENYIATCSSDGEELLKCVLKQLMQVCPPPRNHHGPPNTESSEE